MKKPIPVGNEDFKDVIEKGYYYIDKTLLIKELLEYKGYVNLFTRPRRFGKTLNISMLKYFFENSADDNRGLFENLDIMKVPSCVEQMGQYPVITISFKSGKQGTAGLVLESVKRIIAEEYRRHGDVLENVGIEEERIQRIMKAEGGLSDYLDSLRLLTECLNKKTGRKVILLIDEYDVPLENAYFHGFYNEILDFMRALLESAVKTNPFVEFAVITGCLRISRESIFTGLNNMEIIPITSGMYTEHFGFTDREVRDMLEYYGLNHCHEEIKRWYNGYLFGKTEVYNPWSVVNYIKNAWLDGNTAPRPYWSNTSSNDIVKMLIEKSDASVKQEMEELIKGNSIRKPVHEDVTYEDLDKSNDNIWNFLFFTGYLRGEQEQEWTEDGQTFLTLSVPNQEVQYLYKTKIREWFQRDMDVRDLTPIYQSLMNHKAEELEKELNLLLRDSISFYDNKEAFYHGFLVGILQGMKEFLVDSNKESGDGRYDIAARSLDVETPAFIIELKLADSFQELTQKAEEALGQMKSRHYGEELMRDGYSKIYYYGISFYKKNCRVLTD